MDSGEKEFGFKKIETVPISKNESVHTNKEHIVSEAIELYVLQYIEQNQHCVPKNYMKPSKNIYFAV